MDNCCGQLTGSEGHLQDSSIGSASNGNTTTGDCHPSVKDYKHRPHNRIFVNRSLHLQKIKFYGFDLDYTLAVYKSPAYESLGFDLLKERLVSIGYPSALCEFNYDASFPIRGLWFDKVYGNLLKVDSFGNILVCVHGFRFLKRHEIEELYPNKFVILDDSRLYVLNTLFNLPETYMLACIINYFSMKKEFKVKKEGLECEDIFMPYKSIFQDVRSAVDWLHSNGDMKSKTIRDLDKYVHRDARLPVLLNRMRSGGAKTVLITNSEYQYTNEIMQFLLDFHSQDEEKRDWTSYWDVVVVDAKKPLFFAEGTILRKVDRRTGSLELGHPTRCLIPGEVYSGGSCDVFSQLLGDRGKDMLYIGDHIYGDILKSKKIRGWRTFLIVPELQQEVWVWTEKCDLFNRVTQLEADLSDVYRYLDSSAVKAPDISSIQHALKDLAYKLDMSYGLLGSLFRSGSRQTFFGAQVTRYADIYAASFLNLLHHPFCYMFKAPAMLMPHEATVDHFLKTPVTLSHDVHLDSSDAEVNVYDAAGFERQRSSDGADHVLHLRPGKPDRDAMPDDDEFNSDDSETSGRQLDLL